jgi:predicted dehydrogenase
MRPRSHVECIVKPLRVVILGASFGRHVHAVGFARHPSFEVVGLAGSDADKTRRIAEELGIPHASADWRALLATTSPDVVCVVTPVDLHHPMTMAALECGAHVLCEKPTALHRFQAADMRDRARQLGRVAAINHEFRFQPARRAALAMVRAGAIGEPRRAAIVGRYPVWPTPDARGMSWLAEAGRGGGILGAMGSHHTDCFRTFLGEPHAVLASVRVDQPLRGPSPTHPQGGRATADDACTIHYEFECGATGLVDMNASAPYRWERFEIQGPEGLLRWEGPADRLWRARPGHEEEEVAIPAEFRLERRDGDHPLVAPFGVMVARLHDAIERGATMDPSFDDAVAVQSVLDAVRASSAAGTKVRVEFPTVA